MGIGTYALVQEKFLSSLHDFGYGGKIYIGFAAIIINLVVVAVGSLVAAAVGQSTPGKLSDADYREPAPGAAQRPPLVQPMAPPLAGGTT